MESKLGVLLEDLKHFLDVVRQHDRSPGYRDMAGLLWQRVKRALVVILIMLYAVPASAQLPPKGWLDNLTYGLIAGNIVLNGTDAYQTGYWTGARKAVEANPWYAPFIDHPTLAGLYKAGAGTLSAYLLLKFREDHPKLVAFVAGVINSGMTFVVYHNFTLETREKE